jgi:hypothetical protein
LLVRFGDEALFAEEEGQQALQGEGLMEDGFGAPKSNSEEEQQSLDGFES